MSNKTIMIQVRVGMRSSEKLKEWAQNQESVNDSARQAIEHFIAQYGTDSIDSSEVKFNMAKDLIESSENIINATKNENKSIETKPAEPINENENNNEELSEKKPIKNRGQISLE